MRSLLSHLEELQCLVFFQKPDILALSKTWLDPSITDSEGALQSFSIH
jgi:hypothetical protein